MSWGVDRATASNFWDAPTRTRRITRACDRCHQTNTKCSKGPTAVICGPCSDFGESCTYDRPVRKRGPAPKSVGGGLQASQSRSNLHPRHAQGEARWSYQPQASEQHISILAEGYKTLVYPIFPIFHWPSFMQNINNRTYTLNQSFYTIAGRLEGSATTHSADKYYSLALEAFPPTWGATGSVNYKQAKLLLAISCLQDGDAVGLHTHLGDYGTLSFTDGFYDESRWPSGLKEPEIQERRRLFWGAYSLEVFTATTWGGLVRHRQSLSNVSYPAVVRNDDQIQDAGSQTCLAEDSFLTGWNFSIDLYKVIEYLIDRSRAKKVQSDKLSTSTLDAMIDQSRYEPSARSLVEMMEASYDQLPPIFKAVRTMSGNDEADSFGFQAANITVTLQTLKMVLASLEESSVEQRCAIAGHLLDALASIPTSYIAAISATMLHHLASVGHLLASVIQQPLTQWSFLQVRNVILAMSDLILGLETALVMKPDISTKLKAHASIIDEKMRSAATTAVQAQLPSILETSSLQSIANIPSTSTQPAPPAANFDSGFDSVDEWTFEFSPDHQMQLQDVLTTNWPFDFTSRGALGLDTFETPALLPQGSYEHFWQAPTTQLAGSNTHAGADQSARDPRGM